MKTLVMILLIAFSAGKANAQVTKVSLQASGLTCSMCSKAVLNALQKVNTVDKVEVDIKNQQYSISFKSAADIEFDALTKAVEDAGFSVADFTVTAVVNEMKLEKDQHLKIGKLNFHFLNAADQQVNGITTFTIVDKSFASAKNYKKYSAMSKMECVQTGRMAKCCFKVEVDKELRVYHAII